VENMSRKGASMICPWCGRRAVIDNGIKQMVLEDVSLYRNATMFAVMYLAIGCFTGAIIMYLLT